MEENAAAILGQVSRLMRRSFDGRARQIGVTRPQWQVLSLLFSYEGINQGALAEMLEVEPVTASRMIDRLEDARLVERRADPADRRMWRLFLTRDGRRRLAELRPLARETLDSALAGISQTDRDHFIDTLVRMRANLREMGEADAAP